MTRLRCQVFREAWKVCLAPRQQHLQRHNPQYDKINRVFCFSLFRVVIIIMVASARVKRLLI